MSDPIDDAVEAAHEPISDLVRCDKEEPVLVTGWAVIAEYQDSNGDKHLEIVRGAPGGLQPTVFLVRGWLHTMLHMRNLFNNQGDEDE